LHEQVYDPEKKYDSYTIYGGFKDGVWHGTKEDD
jgi:hypothetical protein